MLVTLGLFALFLGFAIALALFWWFLTQVLPWLVLFFLLTGNRARAMRLTRSHFSSTTSCSASLASLSDWASFDHGLKTTNCLYEISE